MWFLCRWVISIHIGNLQSVPGYRWCALILHHLFVYMRYKGLSYYYALQKRQRFHSFCVCASIKAMSLKHFIPALFAYNTSLWLNYFMYFMIYFLVGPPLLFPLYFQFMIYRHMIKQKEWTVSQTFIWKTFKVYQSPEILFV